MAATFIREQGTAAKHAFWGILAGGIIFCECGNG